MLETVDIFKELNVTELECLSKITHGLNYNRGEVVFKQGDYSRDFYIIKSGQVEISVRNLFQDIKVLAVLKNGDFFGEMALFDKNSTRSATATAIQKTSLLKIPGDEFEKLLKERPTISFKLLGTLSKRLKEGNDKRNADPHQIKKQDGRVITIAAARNGSGKTTLATTLATMISQELPRKVLFLDLDLYQGDGTFVMGVFSPKSIRTLAETLKSEAQTWETLTKYIVKNTDNLYVLPAPKDLLEAEKISEQDLVQVIKTCRNYFDYIIVDTDSHIDELLLNILDLSEHSFFIVDNHDPISIKSCARHFNALSMLGFPESRIELMGMKAEQADLEQLKRLFKFPVVGGIPEITPRKLEHGQTVYHKEPRGTYCNFLRAFVKTILKEDSMQIFAESGGSLFSFFFDRNNDAPSVTQPADNTCVIDVLAVNEENCLSLLRTARLEFVKGYHEKALTDTLKLVEYCPRAAPIYQVLGEIFYFKKDFSMAIDAFKKALEYDPENHISQGLCSVMTNDDDLRKKTLKNIDKKISEKPDFANFHHDKGLLLFHFREFDSAIVNFEKALQLNPNYTETRINLALTLSEKRLFDRAIEQLLLVDKPNLRTYYLLGNFLFNTGKFADSLKAFARVTDLEHDYMDTIQKIDNLKSYFSKMTSLLEMHKEIAKGQPNYPDLQYKIGNISLLLGKREEAIAAFENTLRVSPGFGDADKKLQALKSNLSISNAIDKLLDKKFDQIISDGENTAGFQFEMLFEKSMKSLHEKSKNELFRIKLKNTRTKFDMVAPIPADALVEGCFSINCDQLGSIAEEDLILAELIYPETGEVLAIMPHRLTTEEIRNGKAIEDLTAKNSIVWNYNIAMENPYRIPVRYFHVSLSCPGLARAMLNNPQDFHADFENPNTGATCSGRPDPENPDIVSFVFASTNGKDVVRADDNIKLTIHNQTGEQIMTMEFLILKDDLEEFSKNISIEDMGYFFNNKTGLTPAEKLKEKSTRS